MFKFNSKKGIDKGIGTIAGFVLVIIIVMLIIVWFKGAGDQGFEVIGDQIDTLGDCDSDGAANMFDKCPCDPIGNEEHPELKGCPKSHSGESGRDCNEGECDQLEEGKEGSII